MSKAKPKVTKVCARCGAKFETSRSNVIYCSRECYRRANDAQLCERRSARRRAAREAKGKRVCPVCGKRFMPQNDNRVYCSRACRDRNANAVRRDGRLAERGAKPTRYRMFSRVCAFCGKPFETRCEETECCSTPCKRRLWKQRNPEKYAAQKARQNERNRQQRREKRAVKAEIARLAREKEAAERQAKRKQHWQKVMAEIWRPLRDDEPLGRWL